VTPAARRRAPPPPRRERVSRGSETFPARSISQSIIHSCRIVCPLAHKSTRRVAQEQGTVPFPFHRGFAVSHGALTWISRAASSTRSPSSPAGIERADDAWNEIEAIRGSSVSLRAPGRPAEATRLRHGPRRTARTVPPRVVGESAFYPIDPTRIGCRLYRKTDFMRRYIADERVESRDQS